MSPNKNNKVKSKSFNKSHTTSGKLHQNNAHQGRYDLHKLCKSLPDLTQFIRLNPKGEETIDFTNPQAVKMLNKALLVHFYNIVTWDIPIGFLCPPIPSRADYIHNVADLLQEIPTANHTVKALDIGTGANLIYPIIGTHCYGWQFTATDIDPLAIKNAQYICDENVCLQNKITLRQQKNSANIFKGIIHSEDTFDVTLCNPPFHASLADAMASNKRKRDNLAHNKQKRATNHNPELQEINHINKQNTLNFGGQQAELWCEGGEIAFLKQMAIESAEFKQQVIWFTTLVSKSENIYPLTTLLKKLEAQQIKEIQMHHGQKTTRIIAWSWKNRQ